VCACRCYEVISYSRARGRKFFRKVNLFLELVSQQKTEERERYFLAGRRNTIVSIIISIIANTIIANEWW